MILSLLPSLLALIPLVYACARTSPIATTTVTSVTTTPSVTTTASTAATTTTASCTSCQIGSVDVNTADPTDPNTHNPVPSAGAPQNGCSTLILTCTPINGNAQSLLTFQNGLGGPAPGNPATATLVCNSMGQWVFVNTVITQAFCLG